MLRNKTFIVGAVAGVGMAAAALAGAGAPWQGAFAQGSQAIQPSTTPIFSPPPGAPMSFADIIDRVSPAVVQIETRSKVKAENLRQLPFPGFPFELQPGPNGRGQGGQGGNGGGGRGQQGEQDEDAPEQIGAGSGFFISQDGYIVTNNHVVDGADEITVTLKDQRQLKAKVVGRDPATDLAVVKVDGTNFPFVEFETKAKPRVGDWVVALGNPFGLGGTATAGIVSAYGRDIGEQYVDYIQIDAPINRGNSGGPTFDIYGRVIGVNTAIYSPNGASAGIGFAIPADVAESTTQSLITRGHIDRGYLGVTIGAVNEDIQKSLGLAAKQGAYVTDVTPGGPSDKAGIKVGDIVLKLNGQPMKDNNDLSRHVALAHPGDVLHLEVLREGRTLNVEVRSGLRPSESEIAKLNGQGGDEEDKSQGPTETRGPVILGMNVAPINPSTRQKYNLGQNASGVVVTDVQQHTQASKIGLRPGDVVVLADNHPVTSAAELEAAVNGVKASKREKVLLLVQRDGRNQPVVLNLSGESDKK
jgi:serine protease Do